MLDRFTLSLRRRLPRLIRWRGPRRRDIYHAAYRQRVVTLAASLLVALLLLLIGSIWIIDDLRAERRDSLTALSNWALLNIVEQQQRGSPVPATLADILRRGTRNATIRHILGAHPPVMRLLRYPDDLAVAWSDGGGFDQTDRDLLEAFSDFAHRGARPLHDGVTMLLTPHRTRWTVAYIFAADGHSAELVAAQDRDAGNIPWYRLELVGLAGLTVGMLLLMLMRRLLRWQKQQIIAMLRAERAHRATRRMLRGRERFFTHMSHELRTPLNAVIGFSELMAGEAFGPLGARYRGYAGDVLHSARHLLAVIDNILDLSKIEAGRWILDPGATTPAAIAGDALRLTAIQAERGGIALAMLSRDSDAWRRQLHADARVLTQALVNLLANAIAFTPAGGSVTIDCRSDAATGDLVFVVADTGPGMSDAEARSALAPYVSRDSHLARTGRGTGLGLPLALAFARLHGGELRLRSRPGLGTEATLVLPPALAGRPVAML